MMTGIGMGIGGIGFVWMLLFWGVVIFGSVWIVKAIFMSGQHDRPETGPSEKLSPREILDQRYARGEINKDEFDQIKKDLI